MNKLGKVMCHPLPDSYTEWHLNIQYINIYIFILIYGLSQV